MYANHYYTQSGSLYYNAMKDCVYLNNGAGWEKAYRCVAEYTGSAMKYYGDCAQ